MAVCRGKMSEGIDFADRHGRAVIVTGIPFPAAFDPRVMLKRSFMDELVTHAKAEGREPVSGEQWYMQQAARAVNQGACRSRQAPQQMRAGQHRHKMAVFQTRV